MKNTKKNYGLCSATWEKEYGLTETAIANRQQCLNLENETTMNCLDNEMKDSKNV